MRDRLSPYLPLLLLAALPVIATAPARAAETTCADLLVRSPARTYVCPLVFNNGLARDFLLSFTPDPAGGATFRGALNVAGGTIATPMYCSCEAKGSARRPSYFGSRTLVCVFGRDESIAVIRGKVIGGDGQKIAKLSIWQETDAGLGSCQLQ
ncbi:MAG: hypothetical protein ACRERC_00430 [Candidatus Binatia bacterium]